MLPDQSKTLPAGNQNQNYRQHEQNEQNPYWADAAVLAAASPVESFHRLQNLAGAGFVLVLPFWFH